MIGKKFNNKVSFQALFEKDLKKYPNTMKTFQQIITAEKNANPGKESK